MPSSWGAEDPLEIVYRYTAPADLTVQVDISASPSDKSEDGVTIALERNGEALTREIIAEPDMLRADGIVLAAGDRLDVVLGPNGNSNGDHTDLRITLRSAP